MAEIKVLRPAETRIGAIGIVPMGDNAARIGEQLATSGRRLREAAFQVAYDNEKKKGQEAASLAAISVKNDKTGKIEFPEMPKDLSPTAEKYYEPIARKRFLEAVSLEIDAEALKIAADHERDPTGFENTFNEYLQNTINTSGQFSDLVSSIGAVTSKQYAGKLYVQKVDHNRKIAATNAVASIEAQQSIITELAKQQGGDGPAEQKRKDTIQLARDAVAEYTELGVTYLDNVIAEANFNYAKGRLTDITNRIADDFPDDPTRKTPFLSDVLNNIAIVLNDGSFGKISPKMKSILSRAGFNEATLKKPGFKEQGEKLARDLTTLQGTVTEQYNNDKNERASEIALRNLNSGRSVSKTDSDNIMSGYSITSGTDFGNTAAAALQPPANEIQRRAHEKHYGAFKAVMFNQSGPLPQVAIDYLETVSSMPSTEIVGALNIYEQATRFMRGGEGGTVFADVLPRGLDKDTIVLYETLLNVRDTLVNDAVPEFFNNYRQNANAPGGAEARNQRIKTALGTPDKSAPDAVRDFISGINDDASPQELAFYASFTDDLLLTLDKKQVKKILKTAADSVFKESNFLHNTIGRSQYAPEAAYPDTATMQIFEEGVAKKLELLPNMPDGKRPTLGKDVFLVPDIREGTAMPVYYLVDGDKRLLRVNGKPLFVGNQYVAQKINELRQQQTAALRVEAAAAQKRTRELQSQWDNGEYLAASPFGTMR